jgi:adenylate cyclase
MGLEIERKFLLDVIPMRKIIRVENINQTYLATGDEEVRLRKSSTLDDESKYILTIKKGNGMVREEFEKEISQDTYDQLLHNSSLIPLKKTRLTFIDNGITFETDIYHNTKQKGLITVEVEFKSKGEAETFIVPNWVKRELAGDKKYKNQTLWAEIQGI